LEAIWAEVTIQSNALLPVLRLMALRAMQDRRTLRRGWEVKQSTFYVIQSSANKMSGRGLL
jgi:hypothetical protein